MRHHLADLGARRIADELGIPQGTVKSGRPVAISWPNYLMSARSGVVSDLKPAWRPDQQGHSPSFDSLVTTARRRTRRTAGVGSRQPWQAAPSILAIVAEHRGACVRPHRSRASSLPGRSEPVVASTAFDPDEPTLPVGSGCSPKPPNTSVPLDGGRDGVRCRTRCCTRRCPDKLKVFEGRTPTPVRGAVQGRRLVDRGGRPGHGDTGYIPPWTIPPGWWVRLLEELASGFE